MTDLIIKAKEISNTPGIYKFISKGNIVYIGKSKNLRSRVLSYFRKNQERDKINIMMQYVDDLIVEETPTHLHAIILEFNLIKQFQPIYNAQFKRDKTLYFLNLNNRNVIDYSIEGEFGPFTSPRFVRDFTQNIKNILPIYHKDNAYEFCYHVFPKRFNSLETHNSIESLKSIFNDINNLNIFIKELENKMIEASSNLKFELAIYYKNLIDNFKYISSILISKNDFFSKEWVYKEDGYLIYIMNGEIVDYTDDINLDRFIKSHKTETKNYSYELKSLVFSHVHERNNIENLFEI